MGKIPLKMIFGTIRNSKGGGEKFCVLKGGETPKGGGAPTVLKRRGKPKGGDKP